MLLIIVLFVFLFKLAHKIENKLIKSITTGLICILAIPYLFNVSLWWTLSFFITISLFSLSKNHKIMMTKEEVASIVLYCTERKVSLNRVLKG